MDFLIAIFQTILGFLSLFLCCLAATVLFCCLTVGCLCGRAALASAYTVRSASLDHTLKPDPESAPGFLSCMKIKLQGLFDVLQRAHFHGIVARTFHPKSNGAFR
jgi:hypothetical protein